MTMLERFSREKVPTATGPDEETIRISRRDFTRRRFASRRRRRLRTLGLVLLVLAVVGAGGWLVFFSPYLTTERVQVTGNAAVGTPRVERAARVPIGLPLARVDLDAIATRVETIPAVQRAEVSRSWPHRIDITVVERTPVAVVDRGSGLQAMDARGVLFGAYPNRPDGLPLVKAPASAGGEALREAARVVSALPPDIARKVDYLQAATIDQITLVLRGGRTVLWGSVDGSREKAEVLAVLLDKVGKDVRSIDVSVPGRPTTR